MKGQFSLEYFVSMILFIIFAFYLFFQLLTFMPGYLRAVHRETLRSEAYQVSELLINDAGEPRDWDVDVESIKRVGLSSDANKTNFLSTGKIDALNSLCSKDYENVKKWIGVDQQFSLILIDKVSGEVLIDCHPLAAVTKAVKVSIRRIVAFDSSYGELVLQMW